MSMSYEERVSFWEKLTSRRRFLEMSGKGVAGITVSATLLSLLTGCEEEAVGDGGVTAMALATGLLVSDPNRCTGCRRCEVVCSITNDGKADPFIARVKVDRNYNFGSKGPVGDYLNGDGHFGNFKLTPETCQQCDNAPCVNACPVGAISPQEKGFGVEGTRVVDEDKCIGCGACVAACPFKMIVLDKEERKSKKCFLCNGDPQCAKKCPTAALKLVPWSEVYAVMENNKHLFA